ncbi:MAG: glycosyltransferase family A protein [Planctomycetota bacterium]
MIPTVSIITPLHNKGEYIAETIGSVLRQTFDDWELIVVENGSTDDGPQKVSKIEDSRIRLFEAPTAVRGPGAARNYGLDRATGKWVLFLDADDLIDPFHLEHLVACSNGIDPIIAGGWVEFRENAGGEETAKRPAGEDGDDPLEAFGICHAPWAVHSALVRRDLTVEVRWNERLDHLLGEDICFWFRLCQSGSVVYSSSSSARYRILESGNRTRLDDLNAWFEGCHTAVQCNLDFLKERHTRPTGLQCEMLVQFYESIYRKSRKLKAAEISRIALERAKFWLGERCNRPGPQRITTRVRRALGIPAYQFIRSLVATG